MVGKCYGWKCVCVSPSVTLLLRVEALGDSPHTEHLDLFREVLVQSIKVNLLSWKEKRSFIRFKKGNEKTYAIL